MPIVTNIQQQKTKPLLLIPSEVPNQTRELEVTRVLALQDSTSALLEAIPPLRSTRGLNSSQNRLWLIFRPPNRVKI